MEQSSWPVSWFITMFTRPHQYTLSCACWIQPMPPKFYFSKTHFIIINPTVPRLVSPVQVFILELCTNFPSPSCVVNICPTHTPCLDHPIWTETYRYDVRRPIGMTLEDLKEWLPRTYRHDAGGPYITRNTCPLKLSPKYFIAVCSIPASCWTLSFD